jgi:hypothetical protein
VENRIGGSAGNESKEPAVALKRTAKRNDRPEIEATEYQERLWSERHAS